MRFSLTCLLLSLVALFGAASSVQAQVTYPLSATVAWTPSVVSSTDPTQAITGYIVTYNGTSATVDPTTCSTTECDFKISIPDDQPHPVSVVAVNMWGQSVPVGFTFAAAAPGKSSNVKVRVP